MSADRLVAANTEAWERMWPEVEDDYMLGGRTGDAIGRDTWRAALELCGIRDDTVLERTVSIWEQEARASYRLFPDVLPVLDRYPRIGMVTNGSAAIQRDKLRTLGILDRFDPLVISSEAGVRKPDPAIFEVALAEAGVDAADTWFVGDNLWHDIPGALAAGIRAIWLDREGVPLLADHPQPDAVLRSLHELRGSAEIR